MMQVDLNDYDYNLPQNRIAEYPVEPRDSSKLLMYNCGDISHYQFNNLPDILPSSSLLVFNNTRVIPARLYFTRKTGAVIEVLLLHPVKPTKIVNNAMMLSEPVVWEAIIGNLKKWKDGEVLELPIEVNGKQITLLATLEDREKKLVRLEWGDSTVVFSEVVEAAGRIPLPPYINRELREEDKEQYQTIYAERKGAVAAPTAGLHFTDNVMDKLTEKGVGLEYITLHVGAGTFQPVKEQNAVNHKMHNEQIVFSKENIENLIKNLGNIIPVGTTSMRALESLYWYGVMLLEGNNEFNVQKLYAYEVDKHSVKAGDSLKAVLDYMNNQQLDTLVGETEIFIFPGYKFRLCNGLITNYHMPKSTLLMLIAAFVGNDWKLVYEEAFSNDYRFLSYGDSSLLLPKR